MTTPAAAGPNSIANFVFIGLAGLNGGDGCDVVSQHGLIQQRVGIDGTALIQTGKKGDPFQLASIVDVANWATAEALRISYTGLKNIGPQRVAVGGFDYYITAGNQYFVLDVKSSCRRVSATSGGLVGGGALAVVEAVWTLCPVFLGIPSS